MQLNQRALPRLFGTVLGCRSPRSGIIGAETFRAGRGRGGLRRITRFLGAFPYLPAYLTLALALGATGVSAWVAYNAALDKAREIVKTDAATLAEALSEAVRGYENVLRASAGHLNASGRPTQASWRRFADTLGLGSNFAGIQGLGYVEVLAKGDIAGHEQAQRAAGRSYYVWGPPGDRDLYTSIVYLEPEDWRNRRAIGFDMYSEAVRRRAMQAARDTAQPVLSEVVTLLQETKDDEQPGGLLYYPLYRDGAVPDRVEERRAQLTGFVYGAFRLGDFVSRSLAKHAETLARQRVQVFVRAGDGSERQIFDSVTAEAQPMRHANALRTITHAIDAKIGGQTWRLHVASRGELDRQLDWSTSWMVLTSGFVISLLIAGISASLTMARERSLASEQRLAREVEERRLAQERAQLANNELIHRVKNTLTIVSAIASQTARHSATLPEFTASFRDRLASLGKVHDLLRPDPAYSPELSSFVGDVLGGYAEAGEGASAPRLTVDGPAMHIPRNEAILLSLLLNELATNATKYGAWSVPNGRVRVSWTVIADEGGRALRLVWKETGSPVVNVPSKAGFGTHVMQSIERGMRARLEREFEPDGILCQFTFPLPKGSG